MTTRQRKTRKKPIRVSYEDFRNAALATAVCGCSGGVEATELASLVARKTEETKPAEALDEMLTGQEEMPVHGLWHHVLPGELLLACLRNAGCPVSEELIDEVIERGRLISGGGCGFLGVCGALTSVSAAYAILLESTPVAIEQREQLLNFSAKLYARLAEIGGSRCCKKSSYVALQMAQVEFAKIGFEFPEEQFEGRCRFFSMNETCDGAGCVFFPEKE